MWTQSDGDRGGQSEIELEPLWNNVELVQFWHQSETKLKMSEIKLEPICNQAKANTETNLKQLRDQSEIIWSQSETDLKPILN